MVYRVLKYLARIVLVVLRRWEVYGRENLPASGGIILVANHVSYWDPVVIICAFKRKVHFMAKSELFKIPAVGYVIKSSGAFPVRRDKSDRNAIRTAVSLLKEGQVVGVFPEGTRNPTDDMLKPHLGAAMLAFKAGVPMLPIAVSGTRGVWGKIKVFVGKPVVCHSGKKASKDDWEKASDTIMEQVAVLLGENKSN
ncbi:MAG: 1-acyl-sn-glycerol-3-phosphate acyltransferase [Peptococcaceae bacterium]|nr:1-acyl-sn-glycerol-3-phosphate acyltransferase [Peptococcaceae bacterium]